MDGWREKKKNISNFAYYKRENFSFHTNFPSSSSEFYWKTVFCLFIHVFLCLFVHQDWHLQIQIYFFFIISPDLYPGCVFFFCFRFHFFLWLLFSSSIRLHYLMMIMMMLLAVIIIFVCFQNQNTENDDDDDDCNNRNAHYIWIRAIDFVFFRRFSW